MSYDYYCYGQIKNDKGELVEFSKNPFSDSLKYYIEFDNLPSCFQRVDFDPEHDKELVCQTFLDKFKPEEYYRYEGYVVQLDKFISHYSKQMDIIDAKISSIFKCMGIEIGDIEIFDDFDAYYELLSLNENANKQKTIPVCKSAIIELVKYMDELSKYQYLINIARVFESMAFEYNDYDNTKKSFLFVMI